VTVDVHDGHVRLSGTVDSDYEKWLVTDLADRTTGVQEVDNAVKVSGREWTPRSEFYFYPTSSANAPWIFPRAWALSKSDSELKTELRQLLQLSPRVDANHLTITVNRGLVTLRGNLSSATARGEALFLAYEAGARDVINEIQVGQQPS
jgi:osmotically-inducible protein OsmY